MIGGDYFKNNKQDVLPWVTDWKNPQNQIRHSNNVKDMAYWDWFFCHPSAYKVIYYGFLVMYLIQCLLVSGLCFFFGWVFPGVLCLLLAALGVKPLYERIKNRKDIEDTTFYDIHMREY